MTENVRDVRSQPDVRTQVVSRSELPDAVFDLLRDAFPDDQYDQRAFWPDDSVHALVYDGNALVAHAGLITRTLYVDGAPHHVAYVEYVAAKPRRSGFGTIAMRAIGDEIASRGFAFAGLSTGSQSFYERLGWRRWRGPMAYRDRDGSSVPSPDEGVMVLDLGADVDLDAHIECEWRPGSDIW
jgi:aminoglycoside 2'-N-acetyltransferase I